MLFYSMKKSAPDSFLNETGSHNAERPFTKEEIIPTSNHHWRDLVAHCQQLSEVSQQQWRDQLFKEQRAHLKRAHRDAIDHDAQAEMDNMWPPSRSR